DFKFPDVGEGIHEGTLVKWLIKVGDDVSVDQHVAEVETDKAIVTMPSPKKGKISKLLFKEGDVIKVGEVFVVIDAEGESAPASSVAQKAPVAPPIAPPALTKPAQKSEAKPGEHYTGSVVGFVQEASEISPIYGQHPSSSLQPTTKVEATLAVRKLAREKGVDLSKIVGSGPGGRISEDDVNKAASALGQSSPGSAGPSTSASGVSKHVRKYDFYGYLDRQPLKGVRKKVAEHMSQSLASAPQLTHFHWADVTKLEERREQLKKQGKSITALAYIVRAVSLTLIKHPAVNAMIEGDEIVMKKYYNIGIAVDTQDGLMVPVLKRANTKTVDQIATEIKKLSTDARERKINLMDMKGGTFSVSNLGMMDVEHFTPILNYPEAGLLGVGKVKDEIKIEGGQLVVHKMLPLSFTYDHRVISGADAARFMVDLIALLENYAEIEKAPVAPVH
ncbi:MAG TPA: dihydrolipoamide acetyltransferase family protein, partial [Blastocatellia bacterium]|nr:dihydrolipoamide acetyltransferase family protein [Blastocatellia bacterium]